MNVVSLTELPTYHPPVIEGSVAEVIVPSDAFQSLQFTEPTIEGFSPEIMTTEANLSLMAIGTHVPRREFECTLQVQGNLVTAEAQSGDIAFRIVLQCDLQPLHPHLELGEFNFSLLPNPVVENALWFHEFYDEVFFGGHPIQITLQSDQFSLEVRGERTSAITTSPDLAAQVEEMILFYRQLLAIENTFRTPFRIPARLSARDILCADMVYRAIKDGMLADVGISHYPIQAPGPRKYHEQEADARVIFSDVRASILGQMIHLGPTVFFAPSAKIRCLDPVEEPGPIMVEIDFRQFGGYTFFPTYIPAQILPPLGMSKEELTSQLQEGLDLSPAKFPASIKQDIFEERLLRRAQQERLQRDKRLSVLLGRQRERFDAILTWFAQLDEELYEDPGEITWREPELIE
jgi:hypothetical protein